MDREVAFENAVRWLQDGHKVERRKAEGIVRVLFDRAWQVQRPAFTDNERLAVATAIRDWIHRQPWSLCGIGADTCPDWPKAFEIRDVALAPLEKR